MEFSVLCGESQSSFQAACMGLCGGEKGVVEGSIQVELLDRQNCTGVFVCVCVCVSISSLGREGDLCCITFY